jgi:hypothetical protein
VCHLNNRSLPILVSCISLLSTAIWTSTSAAQSTPKLKQRCAEYHLKRVLFLLRCCGDVESVVYPGPRFIGDLNDGRRADLALHEIEEATQTCDRNRQEPAYLSLQLNIAGANLMKARWIATSSDHAWNEVASIAGRATAALRRFYRDHPSEAASVWKVIEHWLRESGGPWEALGFIKSLPPSCCSEAEMAKARGDLFTELDLRTLAANSYSAWIKIGGPPLACGNESSLSNVEMLRRSGFDLPLLKESREVSCQNAGYGFYVILPPNSVTSIRH